MTATIVGENVLTPDNENVKITELEDEAKKGELLWNIDKLGMNQEVEVTFKVVVLSKAEGLKVDEVTNKAVVEHIGKASGTRIKDETNEIENPVKVPEPITPPSNIDTSDINYGHM